MGTNTLRPWKTERQSKIGVDDVNYLGAPAEVAGLMTVLPAARPLVRLEGRTRNDYN